MPFNGDFYTNSKDLAPTYDFYQEGLKQSGTLPGSWQMRQAYYQGGNRSAGSNISSPGFTSSYARDINTRDSAPGRAYQARSVSGTMRAPQGGTAYGPGSEEQTVKNFFGKMGKLKDKKDRESKEKTPKGEQPAPSGGGVDMGSQQSGNTSNNRAKAKNMNQSANTNVGGNQVISGGNTSIDGDFNMAQIGAGATALSRGASLQHFMFDPNHPFFGGGGGTPQPPTAPPGGFPPPSTTGNTPPPPPPPSGNTPPPPPSNGGPTPSKEEPRSPEDQVMGGEDDASGAKPMPKVENPTGGGIYVNAPKAPTPSSVFPSNPGPAPEQRINSAPFGQPGNVGNTPSSIFPSNPGPAPEQRINSAPFGQPRNVGNTPSSVLPSNPGNIVSKPGTGLELYRGGTPAVPDSGAPSTGAPAGGQSLVSSENRPGFFGRMWNRAADRVMRGVTYGPGQEYTAQATRDYMADTRGLPSGAPTTGLPAGGAPMGALNAGPQMTGYNRAAQSQMQAMGINPANLRNMTYGNSANNGSPASAPIGQVTQRGGGIYGRSGIYGGRGPVPAAAKAGRYGEDRGFMDMGVPRPGEPGSNTGGMPPQYASMGPAQPSSMGPAQPSRHDMNPITGAVRPDFGNPSYTGPSRHPRPPARDRTGGQTGYAGVAMQGISQADSELKRQAFRQRSKRPGT